MNKNEIIDLIYKALENIGIMHDEMFNEETDLNEWIVDSIMFISFIVELENIFEIQLPDPLLQHETISSVRGLADIIMELKENSDLVEKSDEQRDLENELKSMKKNISNLYEHLKGDLSQEEREEFLVEIADQKAIMRDIECLLADLN